MTIYFAGGEDIDFTLTGTVGVDTTAGNRRTSWSRSCLQPATTTAPTGFPPANNISTPVFTALSDIWIHWQHAHSTGVLNGGTSNGANELVLYGSDGVIRFAVRGTGTNGQLKFTKRNSGGTLTDLATSAATSFVTALQQWDLHLTSTTADFYINGSNTPTLSYSGDTTTDSIGSWGRAAWGSITSSGASGFSEIIIANTDTRAMGLFSMQPVANGNTMVWTGSVGNINESTLNDSTTLTTDNNNDLAQFTAPTSAPSGTWAIQAMVQSVRANRGASGPQHFQYNARPVGGSGDYYTSDVLLAAGLANYQNIWATSPASGSAWASGEVFATGFNLGLRATA